MDEANIIVDEQVLSENPAFVEAGIEVGDVLQPVAAFEVPVTDAAAEESEVETN